MRSTKGQSGTVIPLRLAMLVLRWDHSPPTLPLAAWLNRQPRAITLRVMAPRVTFAPAKVSAIAGSSHKRRKRQKTKERKDDLTQRG